MAKPPPTESSIIQAIYQTRKNTQTKGDGDVCEYYMDTFEEYIVNQLLLQQPNKKQRINLEFEYSGKDHGTYFKFGQSVCFITYWDTVQRRWVFDNISFIMCTNVNSCINDIRICMNRMQQPPQLECYVYYDQRREIGQHCRQSIVLNMNKYKEAREKWKKLFEKDPASIKHNRELWDVLDFMWNRSQAICEEFDQQQQQRQPDHEPVKLMVHMFEEVLNYIVQKNLFRSFSTGCFIAKEGRNSYHNNYFSCELKP